MATAPDGSPVELYTLLPERGEGDLVAAGVAPPARLLELGCGTGRMTRQLVRAGFEVTAVDESPEMLAHVRDADTVCASIEGLDLGRRFDAVVLASNLLSADPARRAAFLASCARHGDLAVIETLPIGWRPEAGKRLLGEIVSSVDVAAIEGGVVHGTARYAVDGREWRHPFAMHVFDTEGELVEELAAGGFSLERWLDRARGWFLVRISGAPGGP